MSINPIHINPIGQIKLPQAVNAAKRYGAVSGPAEQAADTLDLSASKGLFSDALSAYKNIPEVRGAKVAEAQARPSEVKAEARDIAARMLQNRIR
jgi:hypothetical protein